MHATHIAVAFFWCCAAHLTNDAFNVDPYQP